jgi:N6-adenosine-specific RNA methylase IME4
METDTPGQPQNGALIHNPVTSLIDPQQLLAIQATTEEEWIAQGEAIGHAERMVGWVTAAWFQGAEWLGERRTEIIGAPSWTGPSLKTCLNCVSVAKAFHSRQRETLPFTHHAEVASLPAEIADRLLDRAEEVRRETGELPPARMLRQWAKAERRDARERELVERTERKNIRAPRRAYNVILADPPWQFEPWSRESGMDRSPENHYPTMSTADICAYDVPAAQNCILYCWVIPVMLEDGLQVIRAWGFRYVAQAVWCKPDGGLGHYFRNAHELLLVGVRGEIPAPAAKQRVRSWFEAPRGKHSEKPAEVHTMIEYAYPKLHKVELFAREKRPGWDLEGYEAPT